jgi:ABC-type bacteriocin/lantibiotic exporter with double-glycine peptidase domain
LKKQFIYVIILGFFLDLLILAQPYILQRVIDDVFLGKQYGLIVYLISFIFVVKIISIGINLFRGHYLTTISSKTTKNIQNDLYLKIERLDLLFFKDIKLGEVIKRSEGDIMFLAGTLAHCYPEIIKNSLKFLIVLTATMMFSVKLTLICLVMIPLHILAKSYFEKRILPAMKETIS